MMVLLREAEKSVEAVLLVAVGEAAEAGPFESG